MVASDDDLIEQMSGLRGFEAFDAIEGELINDQEFGALISAQPQRGSVGYCRVPGSLELLRRYE